MQFQRRQIFSPGEILEIFFFFMISEGDPLSPSPAAGVEETITLAPKSVRTISRDFSRVKFS
jgi:hypothetical protein